MWIVKNALHLLWRCFFFVEFCLSLWNKFGLIYILWYTIYKTIYCHKWFFNVFFILTLLISMVFNDGKGPFVKWANGFDGPLSSIWQEYRSLTDPFSWIHSEQQIQGLFNFSLTTQLQKKASFMTRNMETSWRYIINSFSILKLLIVTFKKIWEPTI